MRIMMKKYEVRTENDNFLFYTKGNATKFYNKLVNQLISDKKIKVIHNENELYFIYEKKDSNIRYSVELISLV